MHIGWAYLSNLCRIFRLLDVLKTDNDSRMSEAISSSWWWFLDIITVSWLSVSVGCWTDGKDGSICSSKGFQYPCPLVGPFHIYSRLSLVTCFDQEDNRICDMSRDLKNACALGLILLVLLPSGHQAQASLPEEDTPCRGELIVNQPQTAW